MKILVLGSGAGGGFPQWNCNCRLCAGQRQGELSAHARTQSSIAVSADGYLSQYGRWIDIDVTPVFEVSAQERVARQGRGQGQHGQVQGRRAVGAGHRVPGADGLELMRQIEISGLHKAFGELGAGRLDVARREFTALCSEPTCSVDAYRGLAAVSWRAGQAASVDKLDHRSARGGALNAYR